jgi:hypothetical protein
MEIRLISLKYLHPPRILGTKGTQGFKLLSSLRLHIANPISANDPRRVVMRITAPRRRCCENLCRIPSNGSHPPLPARRYLLIANGSATRGSTGSVRQQHESNRTSRRACPVVNSNIVAHHSRSTMRHHTPRRSCELDHRPFLLLQIECAVSCSNIGTNRMPGCRARSPAADRNAHGSFKGRIMSTAS